jgi:glycosyltransferase involved in cell wall biosynthesis
VAANEQWVVAATLMHMVYGILAGAALLLLAPVLRRKIASRRAPASPRAAVILFSYFPEDPRPAREAQALINNGFEVDILCIRRDPGEPLRENSNGKNVFRMSLKRRRAKKLTYFYQYGCFFFTAFVFLTLRSFRFYRIVHVHNMPDFLVFSALIPRLLGARIILDLHDPVPEVFRAIYRLEEGSITVRLLKKVEQLSIAFANAVVTPNRAFEKLFIARGCPQRKITIVMNSPDEELFRPRAGLTPVETGGFNIMFHGSLLERNGLFLALDAVKELRQRIPGLKLHIYGEPTLHIQDVMRKVADLGLGSQVEYHGYRHVYELPPIISGIDIGIIPNLANPFNDLNFPTRIFEYLSLGKLAIVPRTKGILDYFGEAELLFFKPGEPDDLARRIEWSYTHPAQAREILQRARYVYLEHRWANQQRVFQTLVQDIAGLPVAKPRPTGPNRVKPALLPHIGVRTRVNT